MYRQRVTFIPGIETVIICYILIKSFVGEGSSCCRTAGRVLAYRPEGREFESYPVFFLLSLSFSLKLSFLIMFSVLNQVPQGGASLWNDMKVNKKIPSWAACGETGLISSDWMKKDLRADWNKNAVILVFLFYLILIWLPSWNTQYSHPKPSFTAYSA